MVRSLLDLLSSRQNSILSGAFILMVMVMASKFLGLIRDRLMTHFFSPDQLAVFYAAFRLPDLLFQLFIFGAISVAFITIFTEIVHKKGEKEGFEFASEILNAILILFTSVSVIVFILARPAMDLMVPGFTDSQKDLTAQLTQIILLGQILLTIGSFFAGIAQSFQRFLVPALASVLYNLGVIIGIVFLVKIWGIFGPAYGVIIGAALHILIQYPLMSALGFNHKLKLNLNNNWIKEVGGMMSMRSFGVALEQINETIGVSLASIISTSSVAYLTLAQHLYAVPIGLFGSTLAQAAMPILARENALEDKESFKRTLMTTMHQILFLAFPSAAILVVLRIPAVRLVFGASQFSWEATVLTGNTVAFMALGLAAQSIVLLLMRGFYALKDTKTPVIVTISTVGLNILLSILFVKVFHFEVWSLGLASSITANLSIVMLMYLLNKKLGSFNSDLLVIPALKMLIAAIVAATALYIPIKALDQLVFDTTRTVNLIFLTGIAGTIGMTIYLLLVYLMKVKELETYGELLKKLYNMRLQFKSTEIAEDTTGSI